MATNDGRATLITDRSQLKPFVKPLWIFWVNNDPTQIVIGYSARDIADKYGYSLSELYIKETYKGDSK